MNLKQRMEDLAIADQIQQLQAALATAKDAERSLRRDLATSDKERKRLEREFDTIAGLSNAAKDVVIPALKTPKRTPGKAHAVPGLIFSDLHLDEVVRPEELFDVNAYDRDIAMIRWNNLVGNAGKMLTGYWTGIEYDYLNLFMLGDNFSGNIHYELAASNADTMPGSIISWLPRLAAGITSLQAAVDRKVRVIGVVGNHGRNRAKPHAKFRARDNWDWFLMHALSQLIDATGNKEIEFHIPESADALVQVYDHTILATHGDQARGGSGWGGMFSPIGRLDDKKSKRQQAINLPYDLMVLGHWHTYTNGPNWIVNGSMKGYDEYAYTMNFSYEVPQQALWLTTPESVRTWTSPVFCQDREKEGW